MSLPCWWSSSNTIKAIKVQIMYKQQLTSMFLDIQVRITNADIWDMSQETSPIYIYMYNSQAALSWTKRMYFDFPKTCYFYFGYAVNIFRVWHQSYNSLSKPSVIESNFTNDYSLTSDTNTQPIRSHTWNACPIPGAHLQTYINFNPSVDR